MREGVSVPQIMQRLRFRNSHTTVVSRRMPIKVLENDAKEIETERLQLAVTYQSRRGRAKRAVLQRWQFEPFVRVWLSGALRASISISTLIGLLAACKREGLLGQEGLPEHDDALLRRLVDRATALPAAPTARERARARERE